MKRWQKLLRRASAPDRERIEKAIEQILSGKFPIDTIKLKGFEEYRVRIGNWRIQFHFEDNIVILDEVGRRDENTYKRK